MHRAWLYVRGNECVWLEHADETSCVLRMNGPSVHRQLFTFETVGELSAFLADTQERLIANGWSVSDLGKGDRRQRNIGPPGGAERRVPALAARPSGR